MAYSDFTLEKAVERFEIQTLAQKDLFKNVLEQNPSTYLEIVFGRDSALSIGSEAARRERYIFPILDDIFSEIPESFTLFSGENFEVDKDLDLKGLADYLICLTNTKYLIQAPIIVLAESKKNDPADGLGQCLAELYAASIFNHRKNKILDKLFGITTNGNEWIFAEYLVQEKKFSYDPQKYPLAHLPKIIGILTFMRDEALRMYDKPKNE